MKTYVVAMTGASGSVFGLRVLREIVKSSRALVTVSSSAIPIIKDETGLDLSRDPEKTLMDYAGENVKFYEESNLNAPISSGSFHTDGMFIVPCSMRTLSSVATGSAGNLIERAADVTMKEGRRLVLAPREMPFSPIHLENMLKLARVGVRIAPPVPAFYHKQTTLDGLIDFIAGKLLDCMGIENGLFRRWGSEEN